MQTSPKLLPDKGGNINKKIKPIIVSGKISESRYKFV